MKVECFFSNYLISMTNNNDTWVSLKIQNIYEKIGGYSNIWKTGALAGSFDFHPFLYFWLSQEQYVYLVVLFTICQTVIPLLLHEWGNVWNVETKQTKHNFFFQSISKSCSQGRRLPKPEKVRTVHSRFSKFTKCEIIKR